MAGGGEEVLGLADQVVSEGALRKLHDEMSYLKVIEAEFAATSGQKQSLRARMQLVRDGFLAEILHRLTHRKPIDWQLSFRMFKLDKPFMLLVFPLGFRLLLSHLKPAARKVAGSR